MEKSTVISQPHKNLIIIMLITIGNYNNICKEAGYFFLMSLYKLSLF